MDEKCFCHLGEYQVKDAVARAGIDEAKQTSQEARNDSSEALSLARSANTNANTAKSTANSALAKAGECETAVARVETKSNVANSNASSALTVANEAKQIVDSAKADADTALKKANSVEGKASTAEANASEALSIAQAVRDDLEDVKIGDINLSNYYTKTQANSKINEIVDANKCAHPIQPVTTAEFEALTDVEENTVYMLTDDTTIADMVDAINDNSNAVATAHSLANEALSTANIAQSRANKAQSTADTAQSTADQAITKADTAQATADQAISEINTLKENNTGAGTTIFEGNYSLVTGATGDECIVEHTESLLGKILTIYVKCGVCRKITISLDENDNFVSVPILHFKYTPSTLPDHYLLLCEFKISGNKLYGEYNSCKVDGSKDTSGAFNVYQPIITKVLIEEGW